MIKLIVISLIGLMFVSITTSASATSDLGALPSPDITIFPISGPPGTNITVTVSNLPDISKENYPYPELYIFLPFSEPFGVTVPSHCGGEDCFPIYTHDDALTQNNAERIITFSLFSALNPKPIYLNGFENSVCDVIMNGKIVERFSTLCNTKDEPVGTYQIKLAWTFESDLQTSRTVRTTEFTVTPASTPSQPQIADNGDSIIKEYQDGLITEAQFESKLKVLGWNDEAIRQAKAVIGKLPHQMGESVPALIQTPNIDKGTQTDSQGQEIVQMQDQISVEMKSQSPKQTGGPEKNTASSTEDIGQKTNTSINLNNSWTTITIGSSVAAAISIIVSTLIAKRKQKIVNQ